MYVCLCFFFVYIQNTQLTYKDVHTPFANSRLRYARSHHYRLDGRLQQLVLILTGNHSNPKNVWMHAQTRRQHRPIERRGLIHSIQRNIKTQAYWLFQSICEYVWTVGATGRMWVQFGRMVDNCICYSVQNTMIAVRQKLESAAAVKGVSKAREGVASGRFRKYVIVQLVLYCQVQIIILHVFCKYQG